MLLLPTDHYMEESLISATNKFAENWLSNSAALSELVKHRQYFDSAFKASFLDHLQKVGMGGIFQLSEFAGDANEQGILVLKTIPTNFPYYPCIDDTSVKQDSIQSDIQSLLEKVEDAQNSLSISSYLIFTMYPCTKTDRYLKQYIDQVEEAIGSTLSAFEYRFTNNAPGVLYFSKLTPSGLVNTKQTQLSRQLGSSIEARENVMRVTSKPKSRLRVGLEKNSYVEILTQLHKEMKEKNEEIGFEELQERFERRVREKLKMQFPYLSEAEIDQKMVAFESKGTGAKKAQILLCTINEPSRIHYRPEIPANSPFNLFVYKEYSGFKIPVRERKIKAFDSKDKSIQDVFIIYSKVEKKGEKAKVMDTRVRDLK